MDQKQCAQNIGQHYRGHHFIKQVKVWNVSLGSLQQVGDSARPHRREVEKKRFLCVVGEHVEGPTGHQQCFDEDRLHARLRVIYSVQYHRWRNMFSAICNSRYETLHALSANAGHLTVDEGETATETV